VCFFLPVRCLITQSHRLISFPFLFQIFPPTLDKPIFKGYEKISHILNFLPFFLQDYLLVEENVAERPDVRPVQMKDFKDRYL